MRLVGGALVLACLAAQQRLRTVNQLQAIATDFRTMGRTAYQRLYEVEMFRQKKEAALGKMSAAALAKMYSDNVQFSPGSDPLSAAF